MAQGLYFEQAYGILFILAQKFLHRAKNNIKKCLITDIILMIATAYQAHIMC